MFGSFVSPNGIVTAREILSRIIEHDPRFAIEPTIDTAVRMCEALEQGNGLYCTPDFLIDVWYDVNGGTKP